MKWRSGDFGIVENNRWKVNRLKNGIICEKKFYIAVIDYSHIKHNKVLVENWCHYYWSSWIIWIRILNWKRNQLSLFVIVFNWNVCPIRFNLFSLLRNLEILGFCRNPWYIIIKIKTILLLSLNFLFSKKLKFNLFIRKPSADITSSTDCYLS